MALINLRRGHEVAPGEHVLTITSATYGESSGSLSIVLRDESGNLLPVYFRIGRLGQEQTAAQITSLDRLNYLAEAAFGHPVDDLDPNALVGRRVIADVEERTLPVQGTGVMRRYLNARNFRPCPEDEQEPPDGVEDYDWQTNDELYTPRPVFPKGFTLPAGDSRA